MTPDNCVGGGGEWRGRCIRLSDSPDRLLHDPAGFVRERVRQCTSEVTSNSNTQNINSLAWSQSEAALMASMFLEYRREAGWSGAAETPAYCYKCWS